MKSSSKRAHEIFIVILNYNCWEDTIECLESVLKSTYCNFKVVVLDNNSPDSSMDRITAWAQGRLSHFIRKDNPLRKFSWPPVEKPLNFMSYSRGDIEERKVVLPDTPLVLIQTGDNLGFAVANNIALKWILNERPGSFVWLLNPDMVIEPDTLLRLVEAAGDDTKSVTGCRVNDYCSPNETLFYGGARLIQWTGTVKFIKDPQKIEMLDFISGGSFFTSIDNFKEVGLLPEEYFLYWEETDWCTVARAKGVELKVCAEALCYNKVAASIGVGYLSEYYYTLNSLKFFKKYRPEQIKYILIANLLRIIKRVFMFKFAHIKAIIDAMAAAARA
jgi:hypothetical protein